MHYLQAAGAPRWEVLPCLCLHQRSLCHVRYKQAARGCLPTLVQLSQKKVPVSPICPMCHQDNESMLHILVTCSFAAQCWGKVNRVALFNDESDFLAWITALFDSCDKDRKCEAVMLCWALWRARNLLVWQNFTPRVDGGVSFASVFLKQWKNAPICSVISPPPSTAVKDGVLLAWVMPHMDYVKVNIDAAIFEDKGCFGFGMVARDGSGLLVEARTVLRYGLVEPALAEANGNL